MSYLFCVYHVYTRHHYALLIVYHKRMRPSLKEKPHQIPLWWTCTLAAILLILFLVCVALVETGSFSQTQDREEMLDINVCVDLDENNDVACNEGEDEEGPLPNAVNPVADDETLVTIQEEDEEEPIEIEEDKILYKGVALAGGEIRGFNQIPDDNDAHLFLYKGMNTYRIPIVWENFALTDGTIQNIDYVRDLDTLIGSLIQHNVSIVLVLYNSMRYFGTRELPVTTDIKNLWKNIVTRYPFRRMVYSLMNEEPENGSDLPILSYNAAALASIRETEDDLNLRTHLVLISGTDGNNMLNWAGSRNARRLDNFTDPESDYANVVHLYFDNDMSGRYRNGECMSTDVFKREFGFKYPFFRDWMINNRQKIFIAEFGVPDTPTCKANMKFFLGEVRKTVYSKQTTFGFIGWTLCSAGKRWDGLVPFALSPGCKANGLMWDQSLYELYLPPKDPNSLEQFREFQRRAIQITNKSPAIFYYFDGYVPYLFKGSANIPANGGIGYLYSNIDRSTPLLSLRIRYVDDTGHVLAIGLFKDPSRPNLLRLDASIQILNQVSQRFKLVGDNDCQIPAVGPNAVEGELRCYTIQLA